MTTPFTNAAQEQWSAYREDAVERGELIIPLLKLERWHPYFDPKAGEDINRLLLQTWQTVPADSANFRSWRELEEGQSWRGMLMPQTELKRLGVHIVQATAGALEFRRKHFAWYTYLQQIHYQLTEPKVREVTLLCLWEYFPFYAKLLLKANGYGQELKHLLQRIPADDDFSKLIPSAQVTSLLLSYATKNFPLLWEEPLFNSRLEMSDAMVRQFFNDRVAVGDFLAGNPHPDLFAAFDRCCAADLPYIALQEVLDNQSKQNLRLKIPQKFQDSLADIAPVGIGSRLKRFVGRLSILERARLDTSTAPAAAPQLLPDYEALTPADGPKWYEVHAEEQTALMPSLQKFSKSSVLQDRANETLRQTLRLLTAPMLDWVITGRNCVPQWALAPEEIATEAIRTYEQEQRLIQSELGRITLLLPKLRKARSEVAIREIERKRSPFRTGKANLKWRGALDRQRQEILNRRLFREQKKREFGVDLAGFNPKEEDVWLDELLLVEEEVRPYMAYVRKAFQAALPVGSTTEFNPYRHRHDGVEFDPDTIQDQDKWLRGEVMKTLRSRKEYASITQVNTFCLDFSRSMNHDLMRNLFKVVFLLVAGLEGRDTYDAIHFFGSKFLAAVDFTDAKGFTSRTALARILAKVATVEQQYVVYSGFGGTNISDAVEKSHLKIMEFSRQLEEERPDVRYVRSILVLTDGQPTVGVINLDRLHELVEQHRNDGDVSIKGIYLKHPDDRSDFIRRIFGPRNAVEASSFEELIATFVQTMSLTYRQQRKAYRQQQKRKKLLGLRATTD